MILQALIAVLLLFVQTPDATQQSGPNVFIDMGSEYCADEIAIAAYQNTSEPDRTVPASPAYMTYSAFEFESADLANTALDDAHRLVARTYSEDPDIDQQDNFDQVVAEVPTEDFGDRSVGYSMNLPLEDADQDVLFIDMMGIIKENQLLLILMFSGDESAPASPGLSSETILPFAEAVDDEWDGQGDLEEAIPQEEDMPLDWTGQDITTGELPTCDQQQE